MPCPQFSPMATPYKTVAAHVVLKGSSSPSLSSGEKLYMEVLSSHPTQSRLQGHSTCAFAPSAHSRRVQSAFWNSSKIWSLNLYFVSEVEETVEHDPWGLEPWFMVVPPPGLWGMGCWPLPLLLLPHAHCCLPRWAILGVGAGLLGQWGRRLGPVRVCMCLASILVLEELFCTKEQIQTTTTSQDRDSWRRKTPLLCIWTKGLAFLFCTRPHKSYC